MEEKPHFNVNTKHMIPKLSINIYSFLPKIFRKGCTKFEIEYTNVTLLLYKKE